MGQLGQLGGIVFTGDQRLDHRSTAVKFVEGFMCDIQADSVPVRRARF
jgi:hypothetical protein